MNDKSYFKKAFMEDSCKMVEYFKEIIEEAQEGYIKVEKKYKECEEDCEVYKAIMEMLSQRIYRCKIRQLEKEKECKLKKDSNSM